MTTEPYAAVAVPSRRDPGIYAGLSFVDYYRISALNHGTLEAFVKGTPAHAREAMIHPAEATPDLAFGHAFHVFVLEPERFPYLYAVPPKCDRRTKVGKEIWSAFEADNPGRTLISREELDTFLAMRQSVMAHPAAAELLNGTRGANELTVLWRDAETGLLCKARLDRVAAYGEWPWVVDLKTTRDAGARSFGRDVANYGYHRQLSWYREGLATVRPGPRRAGIVAVEKTPPYCVAVYELEERALEQGAREIRNHVNRYWQCVQSGEWPGYDPGVVSLDLPTWAVDRLE